ncbi:SpaN/EivJ family type III secretion system needle length determinant [Pseudomonas citrulli]|uniref:Type III secretion effector protein n=1 Tax=Pseudomonas citrulli TaxID=3064347 RepID=A0ABT9BXU2_9PSED|nr:type III secretion effector protein [Pseudomonas sp. K18]MDO7896739.1 type III secretion effector protein [Pseudomonas sp. K18]
MNEVFGVPARPVPALDLNDEGLVDTLPDTRVPAQEEDLPQGVLDLLAALPRFSRPLPEGTRGKVWHAVGTALGREDGDSRELPSTVKPGMDVMREASPIAKTLLQVGAVLDGSLQAPMPLRLERAIDSSSVPTLSVPAEPPAAQGDEPVPVVPAAPQVARVVPSAAPMTPAPPAAPPPPLEVEAPTLPGPARELLQVPFNRGAASGQVTIHRLPENAAGLTLSPSHAWVFEQLKEPFALAAEPAWRLTGRGDEQPRQGSRQAPDDDPDEASERPA